MAIFWERTAPSVNHMFSYILTLCNFSISRFGFEGWIWVLIASVPDVGILFTFKQDARGFNAHTFTCLFTFMNIDKP